MTQDEAVELLRIRWRLVGERFDDRTAEVWCRALGAMTFERAQQAMFDACTRLRKITPADLYETTRPRIVEQAPLFDPDDSGVRLTAGEAQVQVYRSCVAEFVREGLTELDARKRASTVLRYQPPG